MKKLTLLAAAAVLFLCGNLAVFSQNKDSFQENISKNQSFSIDTDPSQIQLNLPETVQTEKSSGALSTVWIFVKMIFALAVVIGISWGIFHFFKKSIKS